MSEPLENGYELRDGTVTFIPERLNRMPVVIRGMTNDEMFVVAGIGTGLGFLISIVVVFFTGSLSLMAATIFGVATLFFLSASSLLQRAKRNKPETWFYRQLQRWLANRGFTWGSGGKIINYHGRWSAKHQKRIEENR